jgi:hypothetical protein
MHWADWVLSQDAKPYSITFHWHTPHDGGAEIQWTRHVQSAESATQLESLFLLLQRDRIWQVLHSDLGHKHEISGLQGGKLSCKSLPLDVLRTYHPGHRKHQRGTVWHVTSAALLQNQWILNLELVLRPAIHSTACSQTCTLAETIRVGSVVV